MSKLPDFPRVDPVVGDVVKRAEHGEYNYGVVLAGLRMGRKYRRKGWQLPAHIVYVEHLLPGDARSSYIALCIGQGEYTSFHPDTQDQFATDWERY
jgi:hypothetical protein